MRVREERDREMREREISRNRKERLCIFKKRQKRRLK